MKIKVISYNIRRLGEEGEEANRWENRKQPLAELIGKYNPDLLCVQEDHPEQVKYLKSQFPGLEVWGFYNEDLNADIAGEANSIFYNTEKFSVIEKGYYYLTETPSRASKLPGQSRHHRTVTYLKLLFDGKTEISIFNTHFDHLSQEVATREAEALSNIIAKLSPKNYIITGDFNGDINSPQLTLLREHFTLIDGNCLDAKTVFDWSEVHPPRKCIDFIFSNLSGGNLEVDDSKYLSSDNIERTPSDHLPVICEL
ncbi:MAG: endonuclease/exonuclease/phosphatase family protein [Patescibacteria group bacterium]|jgi:endonuclease/exonuclease/phosphatase family metal-dependent hydrolase